MESDNAQMKIEIDHLRDLVANAREKGERDKEALKKATRYIAAVCLFTYWPMSWAFLSKASKLCLRWMGTLTGDAAQSSSVLLLSQWGSTLKRKNWLLQEPILSFKSWSHSGKALSLLEANRKWQKSSSFKGCSSVIFSFAPFSMGFNC